RNKVKDFARTRAIGDVPYKIIFLDECDALTREAQQALRRTMENYTQTTRFVLSCNYSSRIIEPIQSRCAVFRFKPLEKEDIFKLIDNIANNEKLKINEDVNEDLFNASEGDCRRLVNLMQSSAALDDEITKENIYQIASLAEPKEIKGILELAIDNNFLEARNKLLDVMLNYGLSGLDIIKQIQREILKIDISDREKMKLIDKCGEIEFRLTEGSDEFIQLECLLANFALVSKKSPT
ncbi:MAG: replication factor C small subunit, partial [Nanoarchaeota archaeon]